MKSRSLAFWRLPWEEETLLRLLAAATEIVVFPILRCPSRKELLASVPMDDYIPSWKPGTILLAPPDAKVETVESRRAKRQTINQRASEVVHYRSGRLLKEDLLEANIFSYYAIYLDARQQWQKKDQAFVKWADKLRKLIKDHTVEWQDRRMTKPVRSAVRKGLELIV